MRITNIQRFSLDDGPGIRTTVFCSGCNLRCLWCHNPEALRMDSREMPIDELVKEIEKDKRFYQKSCGGVTFSGGEPMLQASELETILKECKRRGIHTAIETAGNYPFEVLEKVLEAIDLIIIDCKAYTNEIHKKCTGVANEQILSNIEKLSNLKTTFWVRVPIVFGVNVSFEEMEKIASFLRDKRIERVELLPYHKMGISKYKKYGMNYPLLEQPEPSDEEMKKCYSILKRYGMAIGENA